MKKKVLFYRDYKAFSGGNLKVWDYYRHVRASKWHEPRIYFTPDSLLDSDNPWCGEKKGVENSWRPEKADVLFLGGMDWEALPAEQRAEYSVPIINIIQHVRHADKNDPRYQFLKNKAIRICVSREVFDQVKAMPQVKGPVYLIDIGIDLHLLPSPIKFNERQIDTLIVGIKNNIMAEKIYRDLSGKEKNVELVSKMLPRKEFLDLMNSSKYTIFLPSKTEGFYLPALEGMVLGTFVICPDCRGNRGFCLDGNNCHSPEYSYESIVRSRADARALSLERTDMILSNAKRTIASHDIQKERAQFLKILNEADDLWAKRR